MEAMCAVVTLDTNLHLTIEFVQVSTCIASSTECTNIKGCSSYCIYNMYFIYMSLVMCIWHKGSIYDNILPSTNTGNVYKKGTGPH